MTNLSRWSQLHPSRFFAESWREIDADAARERAARGTDAGYDVWPLVALSVGAVVITLLQYFGTSRMFLGIATSLDWRWALDSEYRELFGRGYWASCRVLGYLVIPMLTIRAMGGRVREFGFSGEPLGRYFWICAVCYLVMVPVIITISFQPSFANFYPIYKEARLSWSDLLIWELLYAAQFFSLEFFFRGFWLKACRRAMGSAAIFAMTVPYCMIHFTKPWMEAIVAIIAGVVLGTVAMRTRSVWGGFLIHVAVAVSMDLAALAQTGGWPTTITR